MKRVEELVLHPCGYWWRNRSRRCTTPWDFARIGGGSVQGTLRSKEKEKPVSLKPQAMGPVPEETARIARAAYPQGNIYMQVRDTLGTIYEDEQFADLFPQRGQPAETPWRLALVSVLQFREGLSDRQAADAVRGRLDGK